MSARRGPAFPQVSTPRDGALDPDGARASAATGNHPGHGPVAAQMFHVEHGEMRPRRTKPAAWADHQGVKPTALACARCARDRVGLAGEPENVSPRSDRTSASSWDCLWSGRRHGTHGAGDGGLPAFIGAWSGRSGHSVPRRESIGLRLACCRPAKPRTLLNSRRDGRRPFVCHRCAKDVTLRRRCSTWNTPDARANRPGDVRCDFRGGDVELGVVLPRATVGGQGSGGGVHNARPGAVRLHEALPASRRVVVPRSVSSLLGRRFRRSPQRAAGRIDSIGHRTEPSGGCAPAPRDAFSRAGVVLHRTRPSVVPTSTWGPATSPSVARGL
jgi:hypothetical protein